MATATATMATTNDGDDGNEDNDDGWRNGNRWRDSNTTATAAMGGATAHN